MSLTDQIVDLVITLENRAPSQAGFGTPLLLGYHTAWPVARVRTYSDADEMLTDGFDTDDQLYLDALVLCSQSPHPKTFKVGRRATALTQAVEIVPTITAQNFVYTGTIDGKALSYTVPGAATVASVCTALAAAVTALATGVTPTATTTKVTLTSSTPGVVHSMFFDAGVDITDVTADTTTDDELVAIAAEDNDWFGLIVCDSQSKATAILQAAWLESQKKISEVQSADSACLDPASTTDVMSAIKAAAYKNTGVVYHRKIGGLERLNTGWMGKQLVPEPGAATAAFKEVAGVTVDKLGTTAMNAVLAKNGSVYVNDSGLNITFEGKTGSGQFIDTTRGLHWLYARIQERIMQLLASSEIVPFTDGGIQTIVTNVKAVLDQGVTNGFLSPDEPTTVTAPRARNVAPADRVNRRLPDLDFDGALGGAIHGAKLRGKVRV